jgi:hypothetical protein
VFTGPFIGHGTPKLDIRPGRYYVRGVIDPDVDPEYGWTYHVVLRFWTRHKGWLYTIQDSFAFGYEIYTKVSKAKR